ncbi:MAG: serine hydroxymethyltransferase [Candidatus Altiarchaeota archaeon]|nr:serine hydroxymethyltransferase [Candidatus Altiarchaeota archaeon]
MTSKDFYRSLADADPDVKRAVDGEIVRQNDGLELIASESYASMAVLEAMSSVMTNKYAEGYPHKRYYGGCEFVDVAEDLAVERAKKLFGAEHVNVQPHSGTQANMAVYLSVLNYGDTILGLNLSHGGHLSHGHPVNFSGRLYKPEYYQVSEKTGMLDMSEVASVARRVKPKLIICGYSAYPRTVDFKAFREIADEVGAFLMADIAHIAGLIAAGVHPSPVKYADFITTTTHKTLRGPRGAMILCKEQYAKQVDKAVFPGTQGGPFMHTIAAKAVCFKLAMETDFQDCMRQIVVNSKRLAGNLNSSGFNLVSGGTDNHLMLVDLRGRKLTGKVAEAALGEAGIIVNKNTIPFDPETPFVTSGIRIGTPCVTIRGMKDAEMDLIGGMINEVLSNIGDASVKSGVRKRVLELCRRHPVYV